MTIDKRINFGGGGSQDHVGGGGYQGGGGESTGGGKGSKAGGAGTGTDNRGSTGGSNNSPFSSGYQGAVNQTKTATPMDIKEQYAVNNPITLGAPIAPTFMSQGLETNRYNNYLDTQNLKGYVPDPVNVPFMPLATKGLGILQKFGNDKNTQFFADNVAGKYGYGYGVEDYQQYMSDRMAGKVGAYGNEEQGQNALNEGSGNLGGIESVVEVQNTGPVDYGPMEGMAYTAVEPQPGFRYIYDQYGRRSSIPIEGYTGTVVEEESLDNDFNFGTQSNPIYSNDLG